MLSHSRALRSTDTDFVPLFAFFLFTSAQYVQVGAVAIVSLLTSDTLSQLLSSDQDAVARLKASAAAAAKAASVATGNATLAASSAAASQQYVSASVALIRTQVELASLLALFVGIFSFCIGILKFGALMNLMGPAVVSGFQTAAAISIALGQLKNTFGFGKNFTGSTKVQDLIGSFIAWRGELSTRAAWSGWLWVAILLCFRSLGRVEGVRWRGHRMLRVFKITGPVLLCIIAILSTKLAELHLSPGCHVYDDVTNVANVYVAATERTPSVWNRAAPVTTTDPLGHLVTYTPALDAPGCVPLPKAATPTPFLLDTRTPWGAPGNPWPRDRGLAITGAFGKPPTGRVPNMALLSGRVLSGAIVITLVGSLESIAISKALVAKHRQTGFCASQEYIALGMANLAGAFTRSYPVAASFSRSALNDEVGATSPVAVLVVACLVGIVLKIASTVPLFFYLPQNALSAIVIVALINLLDFQHFLWLCRFDRKDAALWLAAFVGVLFAGVEIGILIAVILSLALVVVETLVAPMPQLGMVPGNSKRAFRSVRQYPEATAIAGVAVLRVEAPIIFFNAPAVAAKLRKLILQPPGATRAVVLDLSNVPYVDSSFVVEMQHVIARFKAEEVLLAVANPNSAVLHKLQITPLLASLNAQFGEPHDWVFLTVSDAVDAVRRYEPPVAPRKDAPPPV